MVTARVYAIVVTCLLLLGVFFGVCSIFLSSSTLDHAAVYLVSIANLGAIYYLFATGTLGRSWPRPFYFLLLSLMTIGTLFTIQHWEYGHLMLEAAFGGILLLYAIWYVTKRPKFPADHLKVLWVTGFCGYALYRLLYYDRIWLIEYSLMGLLWIIFGLVNHRRWRREQQRRQEEQSFSPEIRGEEEEGG